jgi:tryptophan-rich sensory protein
METATVCPPHRDDRPNASWVGVGVIVASVAGVAVVGGLVAAEGVKAWYPYIPKPAWTPPDWVFGPVWAVLYLMMAVAASVVWLARDRGDVCCPLAAFGVQLAFNLAWVAFFFGLRDPLFGFLDACALWAAVGLCTVQFFLVSRPAGWLMVPYWLWVTFAVALNGSILVLGG